MVPHQLGEHFRSERSLSKVKLQCPTICLQLVGSFGRAVVREEVHQE